MSRIRALAIAAVVAVVGCSDTHSTAPVESTPADGIAAAAAPGQGKGLRNSARKPRDGNGKSRGASGANGALLPAGGAQLATSDAVASALTALDVTPLGSSLTPADLVADLLGAGSGITISNISFTGAQAAAGRFVGGTAAASSIGLAEGVILGTGFVEDAEGPNAQDNTGASHGGAGDADLAALSSRTTFDAAVLEFDFTTSADTVYLEYVFSSDEYNEYANTSFNDAFAIFINGENCAVVAGASGPAGVTINTINGGNPFGTGAVNSNLYRNNDLSDGGGSIDTEMDGLTVVLTCAAPVVPNAPNHFKFAIADANDGAYDSNAFIKKASFSTAPPTTGSVQGQVTGPGDVPVEGAVVEVVGTQLTATTDPAGQYVLAGVEAGAQNIRIAAAGYQTSTASVTVVAGDAITHDVQLEPLTGTLQGTVTDEVSGQALKGVLVTVSSSALSATTGADGTYVIADVPVGSYDVTATLDDYAEAVAQGVSVGGGETVTVDFQLQPLLGGLQGTVTESPAAPLQVPAPLAGATVTLLQGGVAAAPPATTAADGTYAFAAVSAGSYDVHVELAGYGSRTEPATIQGGLTATLDVALLNEVEVQVTGSPGVPFIAVGMTEVNTGQYFIECTDANGDVTFLVPAGQYVTHARSLSICDVADFEIWADPDETKEHDTSQTENANHAGVVWSTTLNTSVVFSPQNYKAAVAAPFTVGGGPFQGLNLQFGSGAAVQCALLYNGATFTIDNSSYSGVAEHLWFVQPFGDETGLPPLPLGANPNGLPRGIASALGTMDNGDPSACQVTGIGAGQYVYETNEVVLPNGEPAVFREGGTVSDTDANTGGTVEVTLDPEPVRAKTEYFFDPLGDHTGSLDLGELITYGWGKDAAGNVTDEFVVVTDFVRPGQGPAHFTLELRYGSTVLRIDAECRQKGGAYTCAPAGGSVPPNASVSGSGAFAGGVLDGNVVWTVELPGVENVEFRIIGLNGVGRGGNSSNVGDYAPNHGYQQAEKPTGSGNSWVVMTD